MKQINHTDLKGIDPDKFVDLLNTGSTIVNATLPFLKDAFAKIKELVQSIQTDKLSTARGKRLAIEELQRQVEIGIAKDVLQKELNKVNDARLAALEAKAGL